MSNPALGLLIYFLYYPGAELELIEYPCNLKGYTYQQNPVYWSDIDTEILGYCYGILRRCITSGSYNSNYVSGTRCLMCDNFSIYPAGTIGTRGCKKRELSWGV